MDFLKIDVVKYELVCVFKESIKTMLEDLFSSSVNLRNPDLHNSTYNYHVAIAL